MSSDRVIAAFGVTFGGCRVGVLSTGAGAIVPWKFCPTTIVAIAPFASVMNLAGNGLMSASPNRFAEPRRGGFGARLRSVVVHGRAEVLEVRSVLRLTGRREDDLVAALPSS